MYQNQHMSASSRLALVYVINFVCSIGLVFLTKTIFVQGFTFPFALLGLQLIPSVIHHCMDSCFVHDATPDVVSFRVRSLVASFSILSNGLSIISLLWNPLYVYQISKLLVVPFTVLKKAWLHHEHTSTRSKVYLSVVCVGIYMTSTDARVEADDQTLRFHGIVAAVSSAIATTLFHELRHRVVPNVDSGRLQRSVSVVEILLAYSVVLMTYMRRPEDAADFIDRLRRPTVTRMLALSALLSYGGSWSAYEILRRQNSLAFQTLGNAKHCFIITTDLIDGPVASAQSCTGLFITLVGIVMYSTQDARSPSRCRACE